MRTRRTWIPIGVAVLVSALAGCGDESAGDGAKDTTSAGAGGAGATGSGGSGGGTPGPVLPEPIDIAVDANRDGVVDPTDPGDQDRENEFTAEFGASFLANLDDDNADGIRDADNTYIDGDADITDLATIRVSPFAQAPDASTGILTIDPASVDSVRLWKKGLDGTWVLVGGAMTDCPADGSAPCETNGQVVLGTDEVRAGVELGIEARRFRMTLQDPAAWTGIVQLSYTVVDATNAPVPTETAPQGIVDQVTLRVAPWMLFGNLSPHDTVWSSAASTTFTAGVGKATNAAGLTYNKYTDWEDQWTQDFFQTGFTFIPGPDGTVRGMRIANARPWGRIDQDKYLPIKWLEKRYLGPDRAILALYKKPHTGNTYDSHGNHDLLPPYEKGDQKFPLGRIIIGSGILKETKEFYEAQQIQAPYLTVDTSWLIVGHVDEFFSYVPASTPRGWKLLVGSARLAREMLEAQQAAGNGSAVYFVGKKRYLGNKLVDAEITIDEILADEDLMEWSQEAQAEIDANVETIKAEVGLADDEIVEIPFLFEEDYGAKVSFDPGTVNLLAFGNYVVLPDPFAAKIDGVDYLKKHLDQKLGTPENQLGVDGQGLFVYYADDWYMYHILLGEVHCGSNPEAPAPFTTVKWWETGR